MKKIIKNIIKKMLQKTIGIDPFVNFFLLHKILKKLFLNIKIPEPDEKYVKEKISKKIYRVFKNVKLEQKGDKEKILFLDPRGSYYTRIILGIIANRLKLHSYQSLFVNCEDLPVCNGWSILSPRPSNYCENCLYYSNKLMESFKLESKSLNQLINNSIREKTHNLVYGLSQTEIENFTYEGYPLGKYITISACSYFYSGSIPDTNDTLQILKGFLEGLIILYHSYSRAFEKFKPDKVFIVNGRFFWHKLAYEMCKKLGIPMIFMDDFGSFGGTGNRWMFSDEIPIAELNLNKYWDKWKDVPLTENEQKYLSTSFIQNSTDQSFFYSTSNNNWQKICAKLAIDLYSKYDVMFTNLTWDSTAIDKDICFDSMMDWIYTTIKAYIQNKKLLLIRVHPAEVGIFGLPSLQKVADSIYKKYKNLPANIKIIPFENNINSYELLPKANKILVYTSTIGLEASLRGFSPIVAGEVHYMNKGFTKDIFNRKDYLNIINLDKPMTRLNDKQIELAKRYAFFYLYRTKIPFEFYKAEMFKIRKLKIKSYKDILPGKNPYLDIVIEGIRKNKPIILSRKLSNILYNIN